MQHPPALSTSRLGALTLVILQLLNHPNSHAQELTPVITERGSHHRVWQQERVKVLPNGRSITNRSSIVELETGMHHQNERGEWLESREEIELFQNGAIARNGPHQVIFEPNINTTGAIDLLTPDRHRLRSHVLGLGLFDPSTGNSELITEIKDSIGELQPPNEIFYRDAFDGIRADLRYTYRKGSFVQDVIVREQVVMPQGFNPATTRLEVWTEFVEAPQPQKSELTRGGMVDEFLVFGAMFIGPGKAFALDEGESRDKAATVAKRWMQIEGRTFLVEAVQFVAVKTELDRLPVPARRAALTPRKQGNAIEANSARRPFPAARQASVRRPEQKIQMAASLTPPGRGLVLDYDLSGGVTNFTFKADTTYYISGTLAASKPTFEGGTVIKYANTNSARINVHQHWLGTNWWRASQYRPVILTARDDHSVGDAIGSGSLSGYYARYGLWFSGASVKLENLRVSHAIVGLCFDETTHTNRHMQFVHCGTAIEANWVNPVLENALVYNGTNVYAGIAEQNVAKIIGHHLTIRDVLNINAIENIYVRFTNCLLINVTGGYGDSYIETNYVVFTSTGPVFQTVGAAAHYLTNNSSYRNIGSSDIGSALLADLGKRTTYPPVVIGDGTLYTNSLTLYPQAQRDTDTPDLGYHYDPLDYVFSGLILTNATITAMPGVAIGTRTLGSIGLGLLNNSAFYCEGTADNLNRFVRYNTVQEQANTSWTEYAGGAYAILTSWMTASTPPLVRLRFTEFSIPAIAPISHYHLYGYGEDAGTHTIRDCQFHGADIWSERPTFNITNSLFNRTRLWILENSYSMNAVIKNSTFIGSEVELYNGGTGSWIIKDNLFDDTWSDYTDGTFTHNYNAYTTNAFRLTSHGANDVKLSVTNIAYQTGPLGFFYIPTNLTSHSTLFNTGSLNATNAGLYHYTMVTNQTRELSTTVDIGFHYVAVGSSGAPLDTDGDGTPNYLEDGNGNGSVDSGETDWQTANDPGFRIFITRPKQGSNIP